MSLAVPPVKESEPVVSVKVCAATVTTDAAVTDVTVAARAVEAIAVANVAAELIVVIQALAAVPAAVPV